MGKANKVIDFEGATIIGDEKTRAEMCKKAVAKVLDRHRCIMVPTIVLTPGAPVGGDIIIRAVTTAGNSPHREDNKTEEKE